jgi:hypothetical protein
MGGGLAELLSEQVVLFDLLFGVPEPLVDLVLSEI